MVVQSNLIMIAQILCLVFKKRKPLLPLSQPSMDLSKSLFLFALFLISSLLSSQVMASPYHDHYLKRHGGISKFRLINRRSLIDCPVDNPYLSINVSMTSPLPDESYVTVTVNGVLRPDNFQWIAMISPSNSR